MKHRKEIDDDVRDIVSDMSDNYGGYSAEEEEKKIDI